jgi:TctA family transporter
VILVFVFIGAFAANFNSYDLVVLLVLSLLGFFMRRYGWPRAPLLLGVGLGNKMEMYLWLSYGRFGMEWLLRPWVIVLLIVVFASLVYPAVKDRLEKRRALHAKAN